MEKKDGRAIGIDLGTTNSVVAIADGPKVRVLDNKDGNTYTRSVVSLSRKKGKEGELLVGDVAYENWQRAPKDTILSVKRLMGRGIADKEVQKVKSNKEFLYEVVEPTEGTRDSVRVIMGGKEYSPSQISAMILKKIKEDAEYRLGESVTDAVITVPAYFSQAQKAATRRAGQEAGLRVMKVMDEPTAAAISYGMDNIESDEPKYILVYDLGGGTFDISVLMWAGNVFAPLALEGDMWLGGDNFDEVLVNKAVAHIKDEYGIDPAANLRCMSMLKAAAQKLKERLTSNRSADFLIPGALQDKDGNLIDVEMDITREQFEDLIRPLVDRTIMLSEKALDCAGLKIDDIAYVIMAGNSTHVPLVQQEVEKKFGAERVKRKDHPKLSVSRGAAKIAAVLYGWVFCQAPDLTDPGRECGHRNRKEFSVCEKCGAPIDDDEIKPPGGIAPFSYGIQVEGDKYDVFINKGDEYETHEHKRVTQTKYLVMANQRQIILPVYGGDNLVKASANTKQGSAVAILPPGLPNHTPIHIKLWLDDHGEFDLSAHLEDGTDLRPWIMKGESDQKAMEMLLNVEQKFAGKKNELDPKDLQDIDEKQKEAFEALEKNQHDRARQIAQQLNDKLDQAKDNKTSQKSEDTLHKKAEILVMNFQFILQRYEWAFEASKQYAFQQLLEQTREAMNSGDSSKLEKKVKELENALNQLPQIVHAFFGMFIKIQVEIRQNHPDPSKPDDLLQELEEVEAAVKANDPQVTVKIKGLNDNIKVALDEIKESGTIKCSFCGEINKPGNVTCQKCNSLLNIVRGEIIISSSSIRK